MDRYGGNGLALKIVGETIRQVYDGDVAAFLADAIATYGTVFGGIRRLLDVQIERLSPVEHDVLTRLAVEREPISLAELSRDMAPSVEPGYGRSRRSRRCGDAHWWSAASAERPSRCSRWCSST